MSSDDSFLPDEEDRVAFGSIVTTNITDGVGETKTSYQCRRCGNHYGRMDHIKRHYRSHENGRAFRCNQCSKSFNRKDLLDRHRAIHGTTSSKDRSKRATRVTKACRQCILAKAKCSDERPCTRCQDRGEMCGSEAQPPATQPFQTSDSTPASESVFPGPSQSGMPFSSPPVDLQGQNGTLVYTEDRTMSNTIPQLQINGIPKSLPFVSSLGVPPNINMPLSFEWNTASYDDLASLFDSTLLSNDLGLSIDDETLVALDQDWNTLVVPERSGADLSGPQGLPSDPVASTRSGGNSQSRILLGQAIFNRSPWQWDPDPRESASSEEAPQLSAAEERLILPRASVRGNLPGSQLPVLVDCGSNTRDALLLLVQEHSGPNVVVRSFPSAKMLSFLLRNFVIREDSGRCPFIHVSVLVPDNCRTELLAAMISAVSCASALSQIWRFGLALQERTRLAIYRSFDFDNSIARHLDVIQAQILWVESGLWSGSHRKMEVAESAAANVPTMLRRAGIMNQGYYEDNLMPTTEDDDNNLRSKWLKWAELESFKRAVLRAMIDDVQSSVAYGKSPCLYSTEITFTLPAARDLWEASDPQTWRSLYLARQKNSEASKLTLLDIIQDASILRANDQEHDYELASFAALHCLWPQEGAYLDAKALNRANQASTKSSRSVMWLEGQRQDLYQKLGDMRDVFRSVKLLTPETLIVNELFMMSLFIWPVDIQKLAGRFGVKESRSTMPNLRTWAESDEPRYAMWHAGQVLRGAQSMMPSQLHGFYAVAVYQACLTLSLPFLLRTFGSVSGMASPEPESLPTLPPFRREDASEANIVILNGRESIQTKSYLLTGQGTPSLLLGNEVKLLSSIEVIPDIIAGIFGKNHTTNTNHLPPLLEKLVILMKDLARLAGRSD